MKIFRSVAGSLAACTLALFAAGTLLPPIVNDQDSLIELFFPAVVVPILMLNLWAWFEPEIIQFYFLGKEKEVL